MVESSISMNPLDRKIPFLLSTVMSSMRMELPAPDCKVPLLTLSKPFKIKESDFPLEPPKPAGTSIVVLLMSAAETVLFRPPTRNR